MKTFGALILGALMVLAGVVLLAMVRRMAPDALGMGVGILLGMLAGLPTMLLVIASGGRGRGCDPEPGRRYEFTYTSEPIRPAQPAQLPRRQPGTAVTTGNYWHPSPVVYYRDEVGNDWRVEDWPQITGGK